MDTSLFFDSYYKNASLNSIMIMNVAGEVLHVNEAFTHNYGYDNDEIQGLNFSQLFNIADRANHRPEQELVTVVRDGNAMDENYIVHKNGREIWTTGESMLVFNKEGEKFIVKDVVNLETTKQLELILLEAEELLEKLFESSHDVGILILDSLMKVIKANKPFLNLFEIENSPASGSSLTHLQSTFWSSDAVRDEIRKSIVQNKSIKGITLPFHTGSGKEKQIRFDAKISHSDQNFEKKVVIIVKELRVGQSV